MVVSRGGGLWWRYLETVFLHHCHSDHGFMVALVSWSNGELNLGTALKCIFLPGYQQKHI